MNFVRDTRTYTYTAYCTQEALVHFSLVEFEITMLNV